MDIRAASVEPDSSNDWTPSFVLALRPAKCWNCSKGDLKGWFRWFKLWLCGVINKSSNLPLVKYGFQSKDLGKDQQTGTSLSNSWSSEPIQYIPRTTGLWSFLALPPGQAGFWVLWIHLPTIIPWINICATYSKTKLSAVFQASTTNDSELDLLRWRTTTQLTQQAK